MKIRAPKSQETVEVNLSMQQMEEIAEEFIFQKFSVPKGCFIDNNGQIVESVEHHTSHSWYVDEVRIPKPTESQKQAVEFIELMKRMGKY